MVVVEVSILFIILLFMQEKGGTWICEEAMTAHFHGSGWKCSIDGSGFSFYYNDVKLTCLDPSEKDTLQRSHLLIS